MKRFTDVGIYIAGGNVSEFFFSEVKQPYPELHRDSDGGKRVVELALFLLSHPVAWGSMGN